MIQVDNRTKTFRDKARGERVVVDHISSGTAWVDSSRPLAHVCHSRREEAGR